MKKLRLIFSLAVLFTSIIIIFSSCGKDTDPPVITILGENPDLGNCVGIEYIDAGATAFDEEDGDLTDQIEVTSGVDINNPGTYVVTYSVEDNAGNRSTSSRTIEVIFCK